MPLTAGDRLGPYEILGSIVRDHPAPLAAPAGLAAVVARCLRKAAHDRYQTMKGSVRLSS